MLELFQAPPLRDFLMSMDRANLDIFEYRTTLILTLCVTSKEAAFLGDSVFVYVSVSRKPKKDLSVVYRRKFREGIRAWFRSM